MKAFVIIETGWFGFGMLKTGLFPGIAMGPIRLSWARGSLQDAFLAAMEKRP